VNDRLLSREERKRDIQVEDKTCICFCCLSSLTHASAINAIAMRILLFAVDVIITARL